MGVLSTVLDSTSRVLTKVINTQSDRTNIEKDIAIFRFVFCEVGTPNVCHSIIYLICRNYFQF